MKRKMIKAAAVLAAMVLALVLSACSNGGGVYIVYVDDDGTSNGGASGGGIGGGSDTGSDNALTVSYAADLVGTWKVTGDSVFIDMPNGAANADSKDPSVVAKSFDDWMYSPLPGGYNGGKLFDENNCVTFSTQNEAEEFIERMNFLVDFIGGDIEEFANILTGGDEPELTQYIVANGEYDSEAWCVINGIKDKIQGRFYFTLYCEAPDGSMPLSAKCDVKITLEKQSSGSEDNKNPSDGSDTEIPFETGEYFTAVGCEEGIKIIFSDELKFIRDCGGDIAVYETHKQHSENDFGILLTNDDVEARRKEYVFPFVEPGKTYIVKVAGWATFDGEDRWYFDKVQCVAGGGTDYRKYLNPASLNSAKVTVAHNSEDDLFHGTFQADLEEVMVNKNDFSKFDLSFTVVYVYGAQLEQSMYLSWTYPRQASDILVEGVLEDVKNGIEFLSGIKASDADLWDKYGNVYSAYMTPNFTIKDYNDTVFAWCAGRVWSEPKYYYPNN